MRRELGQLVSLTSDVTGANLTDWGYQNAVLVLARWASRYARLTFAVSGTVQIKHALDQSIRAKNGLAWDGGSRRGDVNGTGMATGPAAGRSLILVGLKSGHSPHTAGCTGKA